MAIDVPELVDQVLAGNRQVIARALTLVESSKPSHREKAHEMLRQLAPHTGKAIRVGISGVPGAGKSTFINKMGTKLIKEHGHQVAVLAVDPSSTRTGGSILGDRTRMGELATLDDAFIRPSPSGGHLGGVARATREAMIVMEAAGYDVVLVETVGVGQSEVAVSEMVDTFLMLAVAGTGDQLQGNARVSARELSIAMKLVQADQNRRVPVLPCSSYTGDGLDDLWQAILDHREYLESDGSLQARRLEQQREWLWAMVEDEILESLRHEPKLREVAQKIEADMSIEATSALKGAEEILQTFAQVVPDLPWAQGTMGGQS